MIYNRFSDVNDPLGSKAALTGGILSWEIEMYYKPKFCSNCGEKVERREWRPWTSTRFCDVCEEDFKLRDWLPRIVVFLGIVAGIFGLGSFLQTREKPVNISRNVQASDFSSASKDKPVNIDTTPRGFRSDVSNSSNRDSTQKMPEPAKPAGLMDIEQNSPAEAVYFCGAKTKKGKPCTRLVKGGGRCWQHPGKEPMVSQEKLLAPR